LRAGVNGLFLLGTTGEGPLLTPEERKFFVEAVLSEANGMIPVVVYIGHDNLDISLDLAMHAKKAGASAVSVSPPTRYKFDQYELEEYFTSIANALNNFPIILYDIPAFLCNEIGAELLLRVHKRAPNVVGVKVSRTDWEEWLKYLQLSDRLAVLIGSDIYYLPLLLLGASGIISGPANIYPELYVTVFRAVKSGDFKVASECQALINKLCQTLNYGQPLAYIKEAVQRLGFNVGNVRPPLRSLNEAEKGAVGYGVEQTE